MNTGLNIWSALIVLLVGLWDLQLAYKKWQNKKKHQKNKNAQITGQFFTQSPTGAKAFLILGIIFTVGGIVMLFMVR